MQLLAPRAGSEGPGALADYETRPIWTGVKGQGKLGSTFWKSKTVREAQYLKKLQTPDPEDYNVSAVYKRTTGGDSMFRSRDDRFKDRWLGSDSPEVVRYVPSNYTIAHAVAAKKSVARAKETTRQRMRKLIQPV